MIYIEPSHNEGRNLVAQDRVKRGALIAASFIGVSLAGFGVRQVVEDNFVADTLWYGSSVSLIFAIVTAIYIYSELRHVRDYPDNQIPDRPDFGS